MIHPYTEGFEAAKENAYNNAIGNRAEPKRNPHHLGTIDHEQWAAGNRDGSQEQKFNKNVSVNFD